jgi:hypothetical protein
MNGVPDSGSQAAALQRDPVVFNIVYTPGTVRYLSFFVSSLLKWSDACFQLVSNGCHPEEQQQLQRLCARDPRLAYRAIPTRYMLSHGLVLNYLQALTRTRMFCFMDSDIFATGEFLGRFTAQAELGNSVFSAAPVWLLAEDGILPASFTGVWGEYFASASGLCLGSTYLAMYDNVTLTDLMQTHGVGFEGRCWDEIPTDSQQTLTQIGLSNHHFDTGKILTLLSQRYRPACYVDEPTLHHIGGTSFQALYEDVQPSVRKRVRSSLRRAADFVGAGRVIDRLNLSRTIRAQAAFVHSTEAREVVLRRQRQRDPTRIFLFRVLRALFDGQPPPPPPDTGLPVLNERLHMTARAVRALFQEYQRRGVPNAN